jgi:hypothetical protein
MDEHELILSELVRSVRLLQQQVDALTGESHRIELCREQPTAMIALRKTYPDNRYFIHVKIQNSAESSSSDVVITQKQRNGFMISYTGTDETVTIDLWIQNRPEPWEVLK